MQRRYVIPFGPHGAASYDTQDGTATARGPVVDLEGFPLAYFITFRCYGTWLHGDCRGSVDPKHNQPGAPLLPANEATRRRREAVLRHPPMTLRAQHRKVIDTTVRGVCRHRLWKLHGLNVRGNHIHAVVGARCRPEIVMTSFKSWATRRLREAGLVTADAKLWSRHGSTRYLWTHLNA